jgi:hypothetical protein
MPCVAGRLLAMNFEIRQDHRDTEQRWLPDAKIDVRFSAAIASRHDLTAAVNVVAAATCRGGLCPLSRLAKTHSRSSTVLVDEFDARRFKGAPNDILSSPARLTAVSFELMDSHHSHAGAIGQHLLAPA